MKLLYITNGINGLGGLERVLSIKASYLADKLDYEVHIFVLNNAHLNPFYTFSGNLHYHSIEVAGNPISYFLRYRKGIKQAVKKIQPDVISICDDGLKGMLFPILFGKSIPVIYERHVSKNIEQRVEKPNLFNRLKLKFTYKLMNYAAGKFDRFIVLTNGNKTEWKLNNMQVIPNPLPFELLTKSSLSNRKVLVVGKQSFQKGYDRLLQIWKKVYKKHPDWQLEIYGKLEPKLQLEHQAEELNLADVVHFYPPTKNIQDNYAAASLYLMTSRFEGFGMVLIEAMGYGIPCISFDCPHGPADIISDNKDGLLIANGDTEAFSKAIIKLIENKQLRTEMGKLASKNVMRFLPEVVIPKWDALFKQITK